MSADAAGALLKRLNAASRCLVEVFWEIWSAVIPSLRRASVVSLIISSGVLFLVPET